MKHRRSKTTAAISLSLGCLTMMGFPVLSGAQVDPAAIQALDPTALGAMTPRDAAGVIVREMMGRDAARKSGVSQFATRTHTSLTQFAAGFGMGDPSAMLLREKVFCTDPATGGQSFVWRTVPPNELTARIDQADPNGLNATSGELRQAAGMLLAESATINQQLEEGGVPVSLMAGLGAPMAGQMGMNILDPSDYLSTYSIFLLAAADARDLANSPDRGEAACAAAGAQSAFSERASYAGEESIDGRRALVVELGGLGLTQVVDNGAEVTIDKASIAIDAERAVPLRTRFEGTVRQGRRDTRPITIEKRELDYRAVPGSDMYESYRQVMSIGGWNELGPEAEEAQRQMAELERQLESMPANQRAVMERMMGSQLETMRQMIAGGAIEIEVIVDEIVVNPGIPGGPTDTGVLGAVDECALDPAAEGCPEAE